MNTFNSQKTECQEECENKSWGWSASNGLAYRYSNENNNKDTTQLFLNDFKHRFYFVSGSETKEFIKRVFCLSRDPGDNHNNIYLHNILLLYPVPD